MGLKKFFCRLFGCDDLCPDCPEQVRAIELRRDSLRDFHGAAGAKLIGSIAAQAVYADDGSPAAGISLEARVCQGSGRIGKGQEKQEIVTGADGKVALDVEMAGEGWSLYELGIKDAVQGSLFYSSCSDEMTQQIFLYAEPCQSVLSGVIKVELAALDFNGEPKTDANLVAEAYQSDELNQALSGEITELGNGRYLAVFETKVSGAWTVQVQDKDSFAIGNEVVHVLPGPPTKISILSGLDPRAAKPYDRLNLMVQLQDDLGNAHPPGTLGVRDEEGNEIPPYLDGDIAIFAIQRTGYQYVPLLLYDNEAEIKEEVTIPFAATWLENPGLIYKGDVFKTSLYVLPRPNTGTNQGRVRIEFDVNRAGFSSFTPATGQFNYNFTSQVNNNVLELQFTSQTTYPANNYPAGMYLGDVYWQCLDEGTTCFSLTGQMSPTTDPWDLCVEQKRRRDDCICVNIIYPAGNAGALAAGQTAAAQVPTIISSNANVGRCCPVLRVETHSCAMPVATLNGLVGADGAISSIAEFNTLTASPTCRRANCINLYMVPFNMPGTDGLGTVGLPGNAAINPGSVATVANIGAHEIGHTLGLNHASAGGAAGNLMHSPQPHGTSLTAGQCQTVFQTIGSYAC